MFDFHSFTYTEYAIQVDGEQNYSYHWTAKQTNKQANIECDNKNE